MEPALKLPQDILNELLDNSVSPNPYTQIYNKTNNVTDELTNGGQLVWASNFPDHRISPRLDSKSHWVPSHNVA